MNKPWNEMNKEEVIENVSGAMGDIERPEGKGTEGNILEFLMEGQEGEKK